MVSPNTFQSGTRWEQSSGPIVNVQVHEADCWPVDDNALAAKDTLDPGKHPVIAIGGRTAADGRPLNLTGVVMSVLEGLTEPVDLVQLNIADGFIVRQWVSNIKHYSGTVADQWESTPVLGQPVYVDDSADLPAGVTLSMSPFNVTGTLKNPLAGYLFYCQDEYANRSVGGPNAAPTFDTSMPETESEQEYCVLLVNHGRDLS